MIVAMTATCMREAEPRADLLGDGAASVHIDLPKSPVASPTIHSPSWL